MRYIKILGVILIVSFQWVAKAQTLSQWVVPDASQGQLVTRILDEINQNPSFRCFYPNRWVDALLLKRDYQNMSIDQILDDVLQGSPLDYIWTDPYTLVIVQQGNQLNRRLAVLNQTEKSTETLSQVVIGDLNQIQQQEKLYLRGIVTDLENDDPMLFVNIFLDDQDVFVTDQQGQYQIPLEVGLHVLRFSFVDYEPFTLDLEIYTSGTFDVSLEPKATLLDAVIVSERSSRELISDRMGLTHLELSHIKEAPAFLGEPDLIREIQSLSGVSTVGEAAAGFNVRGGSVDQNLILYDGLPIFNSAHAFGFFSAFNADAMRSADFQKGGIPARYGGRISSVLDVSTKEGDFQKWTGKVGIGMITGNATFDGPLVKDKSSLMVSGRTTYSNWLIRNIESNYANLDESNVNFNDLTMRWTALLSDRSKISATAYTSHDAFTLFGDSTFSWHNFQLSTKLDHQFSPNRNGTFVAGWSRYGYEVEDNELSRQSTMNYQISLATIKGDLEQEYGAHHFSFGGALQWYGFQPGRLSPTSSQSNAIDFSLEKQHALDLAGYFSDEWLIRPKLQVSAGLRIPFFLSLGKSTVYTYADGLPKTNSNIVDTLQFGSGAWVKGYLGLEPRLALRYTINPQTSLKLGYHRIFQYLHLITNTAAVSPVDLWQPSGYHFKPQRSDELSIGVFRNTSKRTWSFTAETYYKYIQNLLDFKDGSKLLLNPTIETTLLQGSGYAYGAELTVEKLTGKLTGRFHYTYARTFRKNAGLLAAESVNQGDPYPANYDQPHVLNTSWKWSLKRKWSFTGNFTYQTGRPVTIPIGTFAFENTQVTYFSERNQYRIPNFHRLDLAVVLDGNNKKEGIETSWVFSVYNVYGRKNPYSVFFRDDEQGQPVPYQLAIVGNPFPSVTFNLKFK